MAKVKIINSDSLECLISQLQEEIENAKSSGAQIIIREDELQHEQQHRRNEKTFDRISKSINEWVVRHNVLRECLAKIQAQIKEIEI